LKKRKKVELIKSEREKKRHPRWDSNPQPLD
jgi:hypothetical protein